MEMKTSRKIRVVMIDDQEVVRIGVRAALESNGRVEIRGRRGHRGRRAPVGQRPSPGRAAAGVKHNQYRQAGAQAPYLLLTPFAAW
jgi:hypothetical protein